MTARDVAAALHLVEVAKACGGDPRFELHVAAQDPAAAHFTRARIAVRKLQLPAAKLADSPQAAALRRAAGEFLAEIRPDVVLTGLSTPFDAGLDEAVLAEARVPTALFQDFWGEQNLLLGRGADHVLAIDAEAAARNLKRYGIQSRIVGSARHSAYAGIDIRGARARVRSAGQVGGEALVVGFFGQAMHALAGYRRTIEGFVDAVRGQASPVRVLLRPHPREDARQRAETESIFRQSGIAVLLADTGPVEDALAACDVVVSLFSTCTYDTAYLNRFSAEPVAVPMSLLFDREIADYCRQHGNYIEFPHHTLGLVRPVYEATQLRPMLEDALRPESCRDVWERAHRHLPDPAGAPQRVLDTIAMLVRQGGNP